MIRFGRTRCARVRAALSGPLALAAIALVVPAGASAATCTTTVSSVSAVSSAVASASPGSVICLSDGTYGKLSLTASKAAPGVTVQAEHPGQATIAGATLDGSYITIAQFRMTGTFEPRPGSTGMTADHNLFVGGDYYAVMAAATSTTQVNDVTITNNKFQGRFNEDAIRLNRYHDGPDADPYGILIEGNEFSGNVEYGGHNDVLQSVWVGDHLYFRHNYLHDFGGQGFFVKDQASAIDGLVVEDNLILRQNLPCDPTSLCPTWQLSPFQIFGPLKNVSIRHNTVWPGQGGGSQWLRGDGWQGPTVFSDNVMDSLNSDASNLTNGYSASNNTRCSGNGFPSQGVTIDCNPAFVDPANGDYRQVNGRGVTWKLSDQSFGPGGTSSTPPPPPPDTTPPDTTITSGPSNPTESTSASLAFSSSESGSTFQCKMDAGSWAACTSPKSYSGVSTGSHAFSARATDAAGNTDGSPATWTWTVSQPSADHQPTAAYSYSPSAPAVGQAVSFDASASVCDDAPCTYAWVDDGTDGPGGTDWSLGSGKTMSFTFNDSGTKSVRVTVTDADGDSATTMKAITVGSAPAPDHQPTAVYSYSPSAPTAGQAVSFDASASACDDAPCTYTWVDDGTDGAGGTDWALGSGKTFRYTFSGAGTKNVRLTVTDADGDSATTVKAIKVKRGGGRAARTAT